MSVMLGSPDVELIGNTMRTKRNTDFYHGGTTIGEKEADDYVKFVETVIGAVSRKIKKK